MKATTLKALKSSIAHWKRFSNGTSRRYEGTGIKDCALCHKFYNRCCFGCPVAEATGQAMCYDTPHSVAANAMDLHGVKSTQFKAAAKKELLFLQSLLPTKTKRK